MSEQLSGDRRPLSMDGSGDFVAVQFAETREEADRCMAMLEANGIPAKVEAQELDRGRVSGISIMVPGSRLDVASDLLASGDLENAWNETDVKAGPADDDEDTDDDDDFDDDDDEEEDDEDDDLDDDVFDDGDDDDDVDLGSLGVDDD